MHHTLQNLDVISLVCFIGALFALRKWRPSPIKVMLTTGVLDGRTVLSPDTLNQMRRERIAGLDRVVPFDVSWAAGVMRNERLNIFGPNPETLGHCGWGGSCALADPGARLSAAYVMTRQSPHLLGDPRATRLIEALYSIL